MSNDTVAAIREQEATGWQHVKNIAAQCELNATLAAERMTETEALVTSPLIRGSAFGVSVDKSRARGAIASVHIANIVLPTDEERAERRRLHDQLDAIARRLRERHRAADAGV